MAVTKRKIGEFEKTKALEEGRLKNCKSDNPEDICNITNGVTLDNFVFDKCETCLGVFNYRKIAQASTRASKKDSSERVSKKRIQKEKGKEHLFNYNWYLKDGYPALGIDASELKVFSCFPCGGGSTMGYKLAGFNVLGGVEIDPAMAKCYVENHKPKYMFVEGVQDFVKRKDLTSKKYPDLFELDILDGSPPCSSFSISGLREDAWGKEKKFREGQTEQILDTLFFDFIEIGKILQPKVIVAENVKGILMGEAREYVRKIYEALDEAGYYVQHYTLDASNMGVPQKRERVFFIAIRKDLAESKFEGAGVELFSSFPPLNMVFNEPNISFKRATQEFWDEERKPLTETATKYYFQTEEGKSFSSKHETGSLFNWIKVAQNKPAPTLAAGNRDLYFHPVKEGVLNEREYMVLGSYPLDYNSLDQDVKYLVGMSVPPVMTAQIAYRIRKQWFDKIYSK